MHPQIEGEPEHLRIPDKPDSEKKRSRDDYEKRDRRRLHTENESQERPRSESDKDREAITDGNMRQKVSGFPHKEVTAIRAACRAIEITAEQLTLFANRTQQLEERKECHLIIPLLF